MLHVPASDDNIIKVGNQLEGCGGEVALYRPLGFEAVFAICMRRLTLSRVFCTVPSNSTSQY
jgi:hypothetical protein